MKSAPFAQTWTRGLSYLADSSSVCPLLGLVILPKRAIRSASVRPPLILSKFSFVTRVVGGGGGGSVPVLTTKASSFPSYRLPSIMPVHRVALRSGLKAILTVLLPSRHW